MLYFYWHMSSFLPQQVLHMVVIFCWVLIDSIGVQMVAEDRGGGRGGLLLCGQDHFTRRNADTCSGL